MLAINILKWPGFNQALILSIIVLVALIVGGVLYGKRRPVGKPLSWGEGMLAATYVFFAMFMAYAVVPNQWLLHAQNGLGWRTDKKVYGPGNILQAQSLGGSFPFEINYLQVGDAIAAVIYIVLLGRAALPLLVVAASGQGQAERRAGDVHLRSSAGQEGVSDGPH